MLSRAPWLALSFLLLLVAWPGPSVRGADRSSTVPLGQALPPAYARSSRLWPRVDESGFEGRAIAKAADRRGERSVPVAPAAFASRLDTLVERRGDDAIDPRQAIYSSFLSGRDTIRFTCGHIAEEFGGIPRMILASAGAPRRVFRLAPLAHWNVDAVWRAGDYLIFGCTFEPEGAFTHEEIALWHLPSGRWTTSPAEEDLRHRGFKLSAALPDWRSARAYADTGAVVLQGASHGLVLAPRTATWGLIDREGRVVEAPAPAAARSLVPVTPAMRSRLRESLLAAFREQNPGVDSVRVLEVLRDPCVRNRGAAVLATGTAPRRNVNAERSSDVQALLNGQLFGVFLADSAFTSVGSRVDLFPTNRYGDYTVYFDLDAPEGFIGVYGQGETYGDEEMARSYPCRN